MNSTVFKKALPHIIAVLIFLVVAVVYCRPALEGKVVFQSDVLQFKGMAQQSNEWKEKTGHFPLWIENAFGGMPAYTIGLDHSPIYLGPFFYILTLGLPQPISLFFLACICFYILMATMRINPWIGILGALAYAYSSYDPVIIVTGHITKMLAIAYAPGVLAGLWLLFQRRWILGFGIFTLFFALQMSSNHLQMVYYTMIGVGVVILFFLVDSIRKGQVKSAAIAIGLVVIGGVIGFTTNALGTIPLNEYAKETMRGGRTELTNTTNKLATKEGLNKDYAFGWSYGIGETLTLVVPNIYGGASGGKEIGEGSKFAERLEQEFSLREEDALNYANGSAYWGAQPFTSGPVYLGAVICLLTILGLVLIKGWEKWALLVIALIGIVLAWGKNLSGLNYFLFDHLPYYNKFRAPAQSLVLPQLVFPILAALGLSELLNKAQLKTELWKRFRTVIYITGGVLILLIGFYFMASYTGTNDAQLKEQFLQGKMQQLAQQSKQANPAELQQQATAASNALLKDLASDRQSLYGSDLLRTIVLIALAATMIGLYLKNKITMAILLGALIVFTAFDLLTVGNRYLSTDSYVDASDFDSNMTPTPADQQIKSDPDKNFRVFDAASRSPFEDARASFHHNSLGGYSPAKLGLYQDLIENQLSKGNMQVFNMLNTKYFIQRNPQNNQLQPALNDAAFGPCWLVKSIHYVKDGNEEMKALDSVHVRDTVIIQQQFSGRVKFTPEEDSTASIRLVNNELEKLTYQFSSSKPQFAVFSEIYYDKGWNAYIDGTKTDYVRVDYLLRGMAVPAGKHTIEFRFEPASYKTAMALANGSALIIYLILIAAAWMEWKKRKAAAV